MANSLLASPVVLAKLKINDESIKKKSHHQINHIHRSISLPSSSCNSWPVSRRGCWVSPVVVAAAYQPRKPREPPNPKAKGMQEQKWVHEGVITESLPNGMFRVRLDNQDLILGYVSGKIRQNFIRILPGDKVQIEVSRYDSTRGRIIFRK